MIQFFGDKGNRELRQAEFGQFFISWNNEISRQLFFHYDKEDKGYISGIVFQLKLILQEIHLQN